MPLKCAETNSGAFYMHKETMIKDIPYKVQLS